jgi:hypothetical protein
MLNSRVVSAISVALVLRNISSAFQIQQCSFSNLRVTSHYLSISRWHKRQMLVDCIRSMDQSTVQIYFAKQLQERRLRTERETSGSNVNIVPCPVAADRVYDSNSTLFLLYTWTHP